MWITVTQPHKYVRTVWALCAKRSSIFKVRLFTCDPVCVCVCALDITVYREIPLCYSDIKLQVTMEV